MLAKWENPAVACLLAEIVSEKPQMTDGLITWTFPKQTPAPNVNQKLTTYQQKGVRIILTEYKDVFSDKPGRTSAAQIMINTGDAKSIYLPPYRLPAAAAAAAAAAARVGVIQEETRQLLQADIIEKSRQSMGSTSGVGTKERWHSAVVSSNPPLTGKLSCPSTSSHTSPPSSY